VLALPLCAPLVVTVLSILHNVSQKVFKRKLFRVARAHHHFEALGGRPTKLECRYWIVGVVAAILRYEYCTFVSNEKID